MQIKRYEAADMAEALRMVKREFGDNAVILSAKEVRPGGFFGALRKTSVEITAAADYPANDLSIEDNSTNDNPIEDNQIDSKPAEEYDAEPRPKISDFSGLLSKHLEAESQNDRVSLSSPIHPDAGQIAKAGSTPYVQNDARVAAPFYQETSSQKIIALVGAPGAGKSTTLVKLARHCQVVEKKRIGVISLDRFRMAANGILDSVARIMDLALTIVHDADQLQSALEDLADADVVLIDTPGMGAEDSSMMAEVSALLDLAKPHEIHLVINATLREDVLAAGVKRFLPLGPDHLLFTHMDEYGRSQTVGNLLRQSGLPSAFYGDGVDLFDHLQEMTVSKLSGYGPADEHACGLVTVLPTTRQLKQSAIKGGDFIGDSSHYVANRNSELFHEPTCKSVKGIASQHISRFNSIEQAMQTGLKPCRACCDIDTITKSVTVASGHQHARAI
jgi:flagellar biosynthesis protein FlhF